MSTITKYELLKIEGSWNDRVKYILSLSNKNGIEEYLKQSSYDDLQMLVFLSKSTKNEKNLLQIFKNELLPIKQRIIAGISWLKIPKNEKQVYEFIIEIFNDKNIPFKDKILKPLHEINYLKISSAFFYNLACHLTELHPHNYYNLDAYLVPFCSKDQILNLLSRWSIERFEQIDSLSFFRSKLIHYQPHIVLQLIQSDLNNSEKIFKYFQDNDKLFSLLAQKQPKEICQLSIKYINQLEKHQRFLPNFIQSNQKYFLKKAPNEMIELITIIAINQPGTIKYQSLWSIEGYDIEAFIFPRSFTIDHYVRLFFALYDTCKWSLNHTIRVFQFMLQNSNHHLGLSSIRKRRKWLIDIVINERIGKDLFFEKLINEGNETSLKLFEEYPELTTPLSLHLITNKLSIKQRLSLLRYQFMTQDIFNQFIILFNQTNSNIHQREENYKLFLQCAFSTNDDEKIKNVLQWIQKRFTNERLSIIQNFLQHLLDYNNRFHLQILPKNFQIIQSIIDLALPSTQSILNYGFLLLQRVEHHPDKELRSQIQSFACTIIKQCFSTNDQFQIQSFSKSYPLARNLLSDILISDLFPKYLSKCMLDEFNDSLNSLDLPQIDSFINSFFTDHLPSSIKLQSAFKIDRHSSIISLFLKNPSTKIQRVNQLINKIDKIFFINEIVQRIALRSQRQFINELIQDNKSVTLDKLSTEQTKLAINLKNIILPGLNINVLNTSFIHLTGKQQEHITKIILHDFIKDKEVSNPIKLKSLRSLHHFTYTYQLSLQWFDGKQTDSNPLDPIIICLPITFDLRPEDLVKQFELLKKTLNASNAKYISDAMLSISRRLSREIFLKNYLKLIHDEQFQRLGITANKEILRLLTHYTSDSSLITSVIKPLWSSRLHQDVRTCLILTLLNFIGKSKSIDNEIIIWKILDEAAEDNYLPVIQTLFAEYRGSSRWPLTNAPNEIFKRFVNEIQFKILDHPTSLEARLYAWSNIDYMVCDTQKLIDNGKQICIEFNKDANTLLDAAFNLIILSSKQQLFDIIAEIIQKFISRREEINSKENAIYHRIHRILTNLINHISHFDQETKHSLRSLGLIILEFDKTFAFLIGKLLISIAENRNDLESMLNLLEKNLPKIYFETILIQLSTIISKKYSSYFIQQLTVQEKFDLAQGFIQEKNQGLFVFDLLKIQVFNQSGINREQCQNLLRQLRQSDNFILRQQTLEYIVPWKMKKVKSQSRRNQKNDRERSSKQDIPAIDLLDIFDD